MENLLIGRYKLISHGTYSSERTFTPTSAFLKGEIIYSSEGFLSVQIFLKPEIETPKDLLTYSGTYKATSSNEVEHHIHICSQSKRDQGVELRNYTIEGDILKLSANLDDGRMFEAQWRKI